MSNEQDQSYIYRKSTAPNLADPVRKFWFGADKKDEGFRDKWPIDGLPPDAEDYFINGEQYPGVLNMAFREVLHEQEASRGWHSFIESVRLRCGTAHMLDLMGGAYCVPPDTLEQMDSLTGLRLEDISVAYRENLAKAEYGWKNVSEKYPDNEQYALFASDARKESDTLQNIEASSKRSCVYGDIWKRDTWRGLEERMKVRNIPKFDIIFCKPEGPFMSGYIFGNNPNNKHLEYEVGFAKLLIQVTTKINPNGGVLLTQIPELFSPESIERWQSHLKNDKRFTTTIRKKEYKKAFTSTRTGYIMRLDFHEDSTGVDKDTQ